MDRETFLNILRKYRADEATAEEVEFLHAYYDLFEVHENVLEKMDASAKYALKEEIKSELDLKIAQTVTPAAQKAWKLTRMLAAAAVLFVLGIAIYFMNAQWTEVGDNHEYITAAISKDIAPGGDHAILTLSDGSVIKLDIQKEGLITNETGVIINKTKKGAVVYSHTAKAVANTFNTISTPKGGQYQLVLSDGTKVWLNAASSIRFPTSFLGKFRTVEIKGEAYFEVASNKRNPFKVYADRQEIEVLGTHFNVNTYDDEEAYKTTLLEGSVKVSRMGGDGKILESETIKPGQVAVLKKGGKKIEVAQALADEAVAWKNGYFKFNRTDLKTIMRQVSRWYNVDVIYKGDFGNDLFGGKIKRSDSVSGILRILKLSNINTTIKGRTIIISN